MVVAAIVPQAIAVTMIAFMHENLALGAELGIMIIGLLAGLILSIILAFETHKLVTVTIAEIKTRLSSISLGNFKTAPAITGNIDYKEYTDLVTDIARMADALSARERDITDARREFEILFNNSSDAVFIIEAVNQEDTLGRFIHVNERACILTDSTRADLIGREFFETISAAGGDDLQAQIKTLFETEQHLFEALVIERSIPIEINARSFHYKGQRQIIASARNIAARKQTENQLIEAKEAAEKANLAKSEFISVMSHEIRTPIGAVIGYSEILEMETERPEHRSYIHSILENAHSLVRLIDDILAYGRLSSNRLTIAPSSMNLERFFSELCAYSELQVAQSTKPLQFKSRYDADLPSALITDGGRLHQVITNLINNAIKYSDSGSIELSFDLVPRPDRKPALAIKVKDEGRGISASDLERMWQPFEQLTSRNDGIGGVGLGLSICKRLVELIGGTISCQSTEGEGSCFRVELEASREENAIDTGLLGRTDFTVDGPAPKIICAEDNAANRAILRLLLEKLNQNCLFVENGEELIEHLKADTYDLILLDINMPVMDGIKACKIIRNGGAGEHHRGVYISALTAAASEESKESAIEAGMNFFMTKPFTTQMLKNIIKQYQAQSTGKTNF